MNNLLKYCTISLGVFLFSISVLIAQDFSGAAKGLQSGNATELAKYFDGNVEIAILDNEATYSKAQAEMVLKNFFNANASKSYKAIHNGESGNGSKYQIGELATNGGTYRTYVYGKMKGNLFLIQEIRIENN